MTKLNVGDRVLLNRPLWGVVTELPTKCMPVIVVWDNSDVGVYVYEENIIRKQDLVKDIC